MPQDFIEEHTARSLGPNLGHAFAECGLIHKNQARLAILHHADEFGGRLPRIEGHDDHPLGHDRQMEDGPANGVGS